MISKRASIATGATLATVGAFASLAVGAWGPQPKPPELVAGKPIIINDVQTVHKTIKVKAKANPGAKPVTVGSTPASSGTSYAASYPAQQAASSKTYPQTNVPTVSTHSSGGGNYSEAESGNGEARESENHDGEREGSDD
jgi:hypothetical protein